MGVTAEHFAILLRNFTRPKITSIHLALILFFILVMTLLTLHHVEEIAAHPVETIRVDRNIGVAPITLIHRFLPIRYAPLVPLPTA
jgi:hypothetical protein